MSSSNIPYLNTKIKSIVSFIFDNYVYIVLFIVIICLAFIRLLLYDYNDPSNDFLRYQSLAVKIEVFLQNFENDALTSIYEDRLARRFLFPLLLAIMHLLFKIEYSLSAIIISFIAGIISLLVFSDISTKFVNEYKENNKQVIFLTLIAFGTSPAFIRAFLTPISDMISLALVLISIRFFLQHLESSSLQDFLISLLFALLGVAVREIIIILILCYFFYPCKKEQKIYHVVIIGILILIISISMIFLFPYAINIFLQGLGIPYFHGNFITWIENILIVYQNRNYSYLLETSIISLLPFLSVFIVLLFLCIHNFKEEKRIHAVDNKLAFLIMWMLSYFIFFLLFWLGPYSQRYWLLNFFPLYLGLLTFDSEDKNDEGLSLMPSHSPNFHLSAIFIISVNIVYELVSIALFAFN